MGSVFKNFLQRIFGRTLTEEELYGRRMFGEDKSKAIESIKNVVAEEKLRLYQLEEEARRRRQQLEADAKKERRQNSSDKDVRFSIATPGRFSYTRFSL